ncbi:MAG: diguanylate cyclase [Proteobacteria bacterium]|nr:diguanylate cyclase [Pseudomonadota bacterium]
MEKTYILVVDDRKGELFNLETLLDNPHVQLVRAESGDEALAKILDYEFTLILFNTQTPGEDCCEAAELVRSSNRSKSIPIIFVTEAGMVHEGIFRGYDTGAVDYLFKPLKPHILRSKIGIFLELHKQRQELAAKTRELDGKILELEVLQKELEEKNVTLEALSSLDGLTGLFNRRYFDDNLLKEWKQSLRTNVPLSLLIVDIDHFQNYNDRYGHLEGDDCLRKLAQALYEALLRPTDIIARYGGEEFTAILPDTDRQGAEMVAQRMIENVAGLEIPNEDSLSGRLTVSIGTTTMVPSGEMTATMLLDYANTALRKAKNAGRNTLRAKFPPET